MGTEELLVLLSPKPISSEWTPPATRRGLTPQDVAGALALCENRIGAHLLMIRVAQQWRVYHDLFSAVLHEVVVPRGKHWRPRKPHHRESLFAGIAQHAIFEHCIPAKCSSCKGRGQKYPTINGQTVTRECAVCRGTGGVQLTDTSRAQGVGIHPETWRTRGGQALYRGVLTELGQHDAEAVGQLRRQLG